MYHPGLAHDPARAQDLATVDETENPPDLSRESVNAVRDEKENNAKGKDAIGKEKKENVKENANGSGNGNVESKNEEERENERGSVKGKEREGNENIRKGNGERKKRRRGSKRNEENGKSVSLQANLHHPKVLQNTRHKR